MHRYLLLFWWWDDLSDRWFEWQMIWYLIKFTVFFIAITIRMMLRIFRRTLNTAHKKKMYSWEGNLKLVSNTVIPLVNDCFLVLNKMHSEILKSDLGVRLKKKKCSVCWVLCYCDEMLLINCGPPVYIYSFCLKRCFLISWGKNPSASSSISTIICQMS